MNAKRKPLTSAQKQQRRREPLNEIAQAMGWIGWQDYERAVKHKAVKIAARPAGWVSRTRTQH